MSEVTHEVAIIGGGIAGLSAAWDLRNRDVVVLEASDRIGGRIRSERRGEYWLNLGAHVYSGAGTATGRLIADVGVEAVPVPGVLTAIAMNGKLITGGRVETFPLRIPMSARDRAAVIRVGAKIRLAVARYNRLSKQRPGEPLSATRRRILDHLGDTTFADFTGELPADADAIIRPTITRSTAEPEELAVGQGIAYFALVWSTGGGLSRNIIGGPEALMNGIAAELEGKIMLDAPVSEVIDEGDRVRVTHAGGTLYARHAIVATRAFEARALLPGLPSDTASALDSITYGPTVNVAMLTNEQRAMPYDDIYAIATPGQPFNMIFNMANVLRPRSGVRKPGGSLMMYRSGHGALPFAEMDDAAVVASFTAGLESLFPETRGIIEETIVYRNPQCIPFPGPGRGRLQDALERSLGRIELAGDYLGTWYTESAVGTGQEAAGRIRARLQAERSEAS